MRLKFSVPKNFPRQLLDYFYHTYVQLPKGYHTEVISLDKAIGRIASANALAMNEYPSQNLSAFDGYGIQSEITQQIINDQLVYIDKIYILEAELYRSNDIYKINPKEKFIVRLPKHVALPSSIDAMLQNIDIHYPDGDTLAFKALKPIEKFEGIIRSGSLIHQGECLVEKDQTINAEKVITLARAGLKEIEVYKKPRIVIVSMYSYDNENNISEECIYLKNTLQQWGYPDIEIKIIKPIRLESDLNDPIVNSQLTSSLEYYHEEIKSLTNAFDLILICSVNHGPLSLRQMPTTREMPVSTSLFTQNRESYKLFKSHERTPTLREDVVIRDNQGNHKGITTYTTEDKAIFINLFGDIDEIMMTMNFAVRCVLNRHDPKFIHHHFHQGFIQNIETTNHLQLLLGQYHQDHSGRFKIEIPQLIEKNKLNKFTHSNCIVCIPASTEVKIEAEYLEVFFIKLD